MRLPVEILHKQRMETDEDEIKSRVNFHFIPVNMNNDEDGRKMVTSHRRPTLIDILKERQKEMTKDINQVADLNQKQDVKTRPTGVPYVYADNRAKQDDTSTTTTSLPVSQTTSNRLFYTRFSRRPRPRTTPPSPTPTTSMSYSTSSTSSTATETSTSTRSSLNIYNQGLLFLILIQMYLKLIFFSC